MARIITTSPAGKLTWEDVKSWAKNALFFLIPVVLIYLASVQQNMAEEGFQWTDLAPNLLTIGAMINYIIGELTALLKKWFSENQYIK